MIIQREHVTLRIEDVVLDAGRRAAIVVRARAMNAALCLNEIERAHVEVLFAALERLSVEEFPNHPLHIAMKLRQLRFRVTFADHQQIDFLGWRTVLDHAPHAAGRRAIGGIDETGVRIDQRRPDLLKRVRGVAFLDHQLHRLLRPRKPDRLFECAGAIFRFVGRYPLAENGREAA